MTGFELQKKIDSKFRGLIISKEQALLAPKSIMNVKCNEHLLKWYLYGGYVCSAIV